MLAAVIFDFDGVITDSEILHYRSFNEVLAPFGVELTTHDYYRTYLGLTDVDCFAMLIEQGILRIDPARIGELLNQKELAFKRLAESEGRIIEGVRDFLEMLARNNVPMAICSGALRCEIELVLQESRLREFFEAIVSAEDVRKGKPHPEGFLRTLEILNENRPEPIDAERCIVIEDSHWGLDAARAAGMKTVAVTNTYDADQLTAADKIVTRLNDLAIDDLRRLCT